MCIVKNPVRSKQIEVISVNNRPSSTMTIFGRLFCKSFKKGNFKTVQNIDVRLSNIVLKFDLTIQNIIDMVVNLLKTY